MEKKENNFIDFQLELAKMRANIPIIKEMMDAYIPQYSMIARQYKIYFDALVAEGFTSEQAIEIVKTQGWLPKQ